MRLRSLLIGALCASMLVAAGAATGRFGPGRSASQDQSAAAAADETVIRLPAPDMVGAMTLERTLAGRRSVRRFAATPLSRQHVAQLCWAAQGVTDRGRGFRAAPSAGALYPVTIMVVQAEGVFEYVPGAHQLRRRKAGDTRRDLQTAALDQTPVGEAPACLVITANVSRTATKYRGRAERYCLMEAGHVAQNVLLQATALGLGGVPVGAFDDDRVASVLELPAHLRPVYVLPVGHPRVGS